MIDFHFTINELPPSINRIYHPSVSMTRGLRIKKDPAAKAFEYSAYIEIKTPEDAFDEPMVLSIVFEIKDPKKFKVCDIDNMLKCLCDSLQKTDVIANDKLIYKIIAEKIPAKKDRTVGHITSYKS